MTLLYAVGGRQRAGVTHRTEEWHHYGAGLVVQVDIASGRVEPCAEYVSPPEACPESENPSILFKSGSLIHRVLYVPTQTELLLYDLPSFTLSRYVSLPCFNDVHHVRPGIDGSLLVANTGLDMVLEVGPDDTVEREWSVIQEATWTRFSRSVDYRRVATTKPHRAHPNQIFFLDGELWVTRCNQHDAVCLSREAPPIHIHDARPIHDGIVHGDSIYFTVVSGEVVVVDAELKTVKRRYDLNAIAGGGPPLGWCRGIEVLDEDHLVVAFSRLRPTKWQENVRWAAHRLGARGTGLLPTRLVVLDLRTERLCGEVNLEPAGMNVVFSVHRPR